MVVSIWQGVLVEAGYLRSSLSLWRAWAGGEDGEPGADFQRGGTTLSC